MSLLLLLLTVAAAGAVMARSICILSRIHWTTHQRAYWHFLGFGLGHVMMAAGAFLVVIDAVNDALSLSVVLLMLASGGMIMFDRRMRR